eukprot:g14888.t1 g14888   contig21:86738-89844(+)
MVSVDARARLLALRRLEKVLLSRKDTRVDIPRGVFNSLLSICMSRDPEEAKLVSSRCLGEMKAAGFVSGDADQHNDKDSSDETAMEGDEPLLRVKGKALSMVAELLLSSCAETSFVAMKTAKALLATSDGKACFGELDDYTKGILAPFITNDNSQRKEELSMSRAYLDRLKAIGGLSQSNDNNTWCWCDGLWTCIDDSDSSADTWIKNTVCSMISCNFGRKSNCNGEDFFRLCQALCAKEAAFSATIFPAIIIHLLDSEARDTHDGRDISIRDKILSNAAVGSPASQMNQLISRCFSRLLGSKSSGGGVQMAPQAVTVVLNTLELLRFITERRFLSSPDHKRNVIDLPKTQSTAASTKRKVSLKSSETISDALPSPPKWRGVPFGVVLQLDGLDVADACFRVKRYYTALYYCEMAMNNVSRCGNYFETIAGESHHDLNNTYIADISGFGLEQKQNTRTVLESALVALNISQRCLAQLQQLDALQGVGAQGSDMMLKQNINSFDTLQGSHRDKTLPMLLDIDVGLQEDVAAGTVSNEATSFRDISTCLEELGLNHTKRHYLAGIASMLGSDGRQDENNHYLREKWFEDSLNRTFQWDDSLLPKRSEGETASEATQFINQQFRDDRPVGTHCQPQNDRFYEPIHDALRSFVGEDVSSGLSHILEARRSVLADIEVLHGSESKLKSTTTHISKLNILGNLELVARAMEHSVPLQFVLNRWEFGEAGENDLKTLLLSGDESFDIKEQSTAIDGSLFRLIQTDLSVKEVLLKVLMKKFAQQEDISESIASHIYTTCQVYRDLGRPDAATSSLSRLRSLVQTFQQSETHSFPSDLPLMLRLEDAKTLSRKHDFDSAIAHSKMIVSHLNMLESTSDADQIQFHAEALLLGGLWMSHQNVDATVTIETFFQKAATLSFQVHSENSSSERTTLQASVAFFKLGEFASSLYASASAKVSSEAWKRRCLVASERKKELETLRPGVVKLQKKYNRNQTDQNRSVYEEAALPLYDVGERD